MQRAAVLGSPIAHSLSPALHQAAYRYLGLDWQYSAIECTKSEFPAFLTSLGEQWRGLSLTMPLKEVVFEVIDQISDVARVVHSANTIFRSGPTSTWQATNTDIAGMENSLRETGVVAIDSARVLGAGATARSAVAAIAGLGGSRVVIHARRRDAAQTVADLAQKLGLVPDVADLTPKTLDCDLLVSTLPADIAAPWTVVARNVATTALLDASYHPWPTPLAQAWNRAGGSQVASGRDMLVWQAVGQVRLMTGVDFDDASVVEAMRNAV